MVEDLFRAIDRAWVRGGDRIELRVLGSTALMLQTDYARGTKDGDILETTALSSVKEPLLRLAGEGTELARRHRVYIDVVPNGLPFLPLAARWQPLTTLNAELEILEVQALHVVDVVVSKLKRFHANDRADIQAMIDRGLVPHHDLVARFQQAVDRCSADARAEDLPRYVTSFHQVERDMLGVAETMIDLPDWI